MAPPDPARKYCTPIVGKSSGHKCNFCGHEMGGGGITRVKNHLAHIDAGKNVKMCDQVPPEVMEEMRDLIRGNIEKKKKKQSLDETIRRTTNMPVFDDEEDPNLEYEAQLRAAMKRSRQDAARSEWDARVQSGPGGGSGAKPPPAAPSLYKSPSSRQPRVDEVVDPKKKTWLGRSITKFFVHQHVPASKADSHEFKNMIVTAQNLGNSHHHLLHLIFWCVILFKI